MTNPATDTDDPLFAYILTILIPLLMTTTLAQATQAARQAIAAYKAAAQDQLLSVAQIVSFALASLDDLRLSAPPDLSLSMKLKLRGNANALNHATQRSTTVLEAQRRDYLTSVEIPTDQEALNHLEANALAALEQAQAALHQSANLDAPETKSAKPTSSLLRKTERTQQDRQELNSHSVQPNRPGLNTQPTNQTPHKPDPHSDPDRKTIWANAMKDIAAESARDLNKLSPHQRHAEVIRIGALSDIVQYLAKGGATPGKADLLSSTTLGRIQT